MVEGRVTRSYVGQLWSIICQPTQVTLARQVGTQFTYPGGMEG